VRCGKTKQTAADNLIAARLDIELSSNHLKSKVKNQTPQVVWLIGALSLWSH
jgi:flagellar basal body-associated protein FliL